MVALGLSILASVSAAAQTADRSREGVWYVADSTDNNTGERTVYALQLYFESDVFVSLYLRCSKGRPTFFFDWDKVSFPDQTVLTISPLASDGTNVASESFVIEKSEEDSDGRFKATPEVSAKIVSRLGSAKQAAFTSYPSSRARTMTIEVDGTQRAWERVSRHCPVKTMPTPPM